MPNEQLKTLEDKLSYAYDTKVAIHDAIVAKGVDIPEGTVFRDYAAKIGEIESGGSTGLEFSNVTINPSASDWTAQTFGVEYVGKLSTGNASYKTSRITKDSVTVQVLVGSALVIDSDFYDGSSSSINATKETIDGIGCFIINGISSIDVSNGGR